MFKLICFILCGDIFQNAAGDYENEDRMYQISPDQHIETPRLEDFFWTGSGDGPPPPAPRPQPSAPRNPTVATTTVIATVYLDALPPQEVTDKTTGECVRNCDEVAPDGLVPEIPEDRRYWLLTVIQGATPDSLQLRLARLYQKAFLRQQERHLGIIKSLDAPTSRKKHDVHSFLKDKPDNLESLDAAKMISPEIQSSIVNDINIVPTKIWNVSHRMPKVFVDGLEMYPADFQETDKLSEIKATVVNDVESWILATPVYIQKRDTRTADDKSVQENEKLEDMNYSEEDINLEEISNETLVFKREILKPEQQPPVQVHIQNVTEESESGSVQIVYVVLVGGRAVPAAVAARDMRLVRDAEVARELGAAVNIKAEPAYLKEAEGLQGEAVPGIHGTELWALAVGTAMAVLLLLALVVLLCMAHRKKAMKSASSLRAYRDEMIREIERNRLKEVHEEKDGKLITVVSPSRSRTRPSSTLLPVFRTASSASSTSSSGVSEVTMATAIRRRQKKSHALRMPQKKRVGTTDSLLAAAGLESSDSGQQSVPLTPTSYLSMPSINSFPRGNTVEPLSRILEPVSVSHLDLDSPVSSPKDPRPRTGDHRLTDPRSSADPRVPRRQMSSQLVRLGSIDKDPGVVGPLVWDLHCQRIKDGPNPVSPSSVTPRSKGVSRMRQRFNELVDDTFSLFGSAGAGAGAGGAGGSDSHGTAGVGDSGDRDTDHMQVTQARNDNVRLPSPYSAAALPARGQSAGGGGAGWGARGGARPLTSGPRPGPARREPPAQAWPATGSGIHSAQTLLAPTVNPALVLSTGRLPANDPAVPVMAAIRTEIRRVRDQARPPT